MSCVSALIVVRLDAQTPGPVRLLARFAYDDRDPFAVRATFFDGSTVLARWHFDRQMLADGLHRPVGVGDVAFRPCRGAGVDELRVTLRASGAGQGHKAVLLVDARALRVFLEQTYAVTGAGEEFLDLDALLEELLAR
ncbi:SsgA family sporulation/cell division regulator [Streptomyces sp. cmx-4-9]|uniref:SsgA family sporulation/cell division regulator n=1 Tax=Streptomyces sp. cmx-4-9 TaxID=2790941 RepID=UPI00397FF82F